MILNKIKIKKLNETQDKDLLSMKLSLNLK